VLKTLNQNRELVTIRNTHHSTNGQTLTDETQIDISLLNAVRFNESRMEVTAGPGTSWNDILTAIQLPKYCTPIFPNNPGQRIRIGGTASVGGVGYYGSSVGGFWNHVSALKLVAMTGEIIECSRTQNPDLFRYTLGGFGRVGVIGELTVSVVTSKPYVLGMILAYRDDEIFQQAFWSALEDDRFQGVAAQEDVSNWSTEELAEVGINLKLLIVLMELDNADMLKATVRGIRQDYSGAITLFLKAGKKRGTLDVTLEPQLFPKQDLIYFYPTEENFLIYLLNKASLFLCGRQIFSDRRARNLKHPWSDCIVSRSNYTAFVTDAKKIIAKYGMANFLEKQSMFHGLINIDSFVTFGIKRITPGQEPLFPVALDLPGELVHALGVAIMPNVPPDRLEEGEKMSDELTDKTYEYNGRRYLYGYHKLSQQQVEQHFGINVIREWQRLKNQCDPNHLLNIDVIEHVDHYGIPAGVVSS
jgi:FAD/FMN-containing dehydrogenase